MNDNSARRVIRWLSGSASGSRIGLNYSSPLPDRASLRLANTTEKKLTMLVEVCAL